MERAVVYLISFCLAMLIASLQADGYQTRGYGMCTNIEYHYMSPALQTRYQCQMFKRIMDEIESDRLHSENVLSHLQTQMYSIDQKIDTMKSGITEDIYESRAMRDYPRDFPRASGNIISFQNNRDVPLLEDCSDLYEYGVRISGVYPIRIKDGSIVMVYCDMESNGGGWTVIQNRINGQVNFSRNWEEYTHGFGNPNSEYWLGNTHLNKLTISRNYTLRIDLGDWENGTSYAEYTNFRVEGIEENFRLYISGYRGTAEDSFKSYHNGMQFSTPDSDNDLWFGHCAEKDGAGWWYRGCGYSSLNGRYYRMGKIPLGPDGVVNRGVLWHSWKQDYLYSLKNTNMKIRRKRKP
ncbi:microfibril-associated glycoprotein 4-like [Lineus longissimus]|uniref:microfibril-associated glycoprotein 4-like n=1 Tax=Lineus longissimus TaxID=88925 RepID=UPI002B4F9DDE